MNRLLKLAAVGGAGYLAWQFLRPTYDFRNKNVLITGGSRGLGLVLARHLSDRGARLGICGRDAAEVERAADDLRGRGAVVAALPCDVTDREQVRHWIAECRGQLGPTDVLINNAGIIGVGPLEMMRLEDFEEALKISVWAPLYTTLEVLPDMKARGAGRIANISSIGGKIALPHLTPYVTGKFALVGLSNGLRQELAKFGIVVTTICPGLMRTGGHVNAEFKGRHREEFAWFSLGSSIPGVSMNADRAAEKVLSSIARGDAEIVLSLPAKLLVAMNGFAPNLTSAAMAFVNEYVLPAAGGIREDRIKGEQSRGILPEAATYLSDIAAEANNELARL